MLVTPKQMIEENYQFLRMLCLKYAAKSRCLEWEDLFQQSCLELMRGGDREIQEDLRGYLATVIIHQRRNMYARINCQKRDWKATSSIEEGGYLLHGMGAKDIENPLLLKEILPMVSAALGKRGRRECPELLGLGDPIKESNVINQFRWRIRQRIKRMPCLQPATGTREGSGTAAGTVSGSTSGAPRPRQKAVAA